MKQRSVAIIGLGNWGTSLACALRHADVTIEEGIVSKKGKGRAAKGTPGLSRTVLDQSMLAADIFWLCVPDAVIAPVARALVRRAASLSVPLQGRLVVHSSGALSTEVLQAVALAGASVASAHPMMSFPGRQPVSLTGVPFGVEADPAAQRVLFAIIRRVGGHPFSVAPGGKALYHAAGMFASPLLVAHLAAGLQAAELAGIRPQDARDLLQPIAQATLTNFFKHGAGQSFSGPIARGDSETIRLHLWALSLHPMLADVYRSLARYSVKMAPSPGKKQLLQLLSTDDLRSQQGNGKRRALRVRNYKGTN